MERLLGELGISIVPSADGASASEFRGQDALHALQYLSTNYLTSTGITAQRGRYAAGKGGEGKERGGRGELAKRLTAAGAILA